MTKPKTPTTMADIRRMVDCWRRILGLTNWDIVVNFQAVLDDGRTMGVFWVPGYLSAGVMASDDVLNLRPERAEMAVIHELLHLVFAPVDDRLSEMVGSGAVKNAYDREMDRAIDGLSVCLAGAGYV